MSLKTVLISALTAMGLANAAQHGPQVTHRTLPDPKIGGHKKSSRQSNNYRMRYYRNRNAAPRRGAAQGGGCGYTAPPPQNKTRRKPNKLEIVMMELKHRRSVIALGGDPDAGDTLTINHDGFLSLKRLARREPEIREMRCIGEEQARYVAR